MKHLSLLALAATMALPVLAQTVPGEYPGYCFNRLSPNGKWAVSNAGDNAPLVIIDFTTGEEYPYEEVYSNGTGNYISNTGVVVGYEFLTEIASYWQNGEWHPLMPETFTGLSHAQGITPDGTMIVGTMSPKSYAGNNEGLMSVPVFWTLQDDGTYGEPTMLPYPTTDFMGREPMRVTATVVSDDGRTIAGQVMDFSGFVCQPIVFTCDAQGNWSYETYLDELYEPDGITLPPYPGDQGPTPQEFMTEEEKQAYNDALKEWEETTPDDYDYYPDYSNYMEADEVEEFEAAARAFNDALFEYYDAVYAWIAQVPIFSYNNVLMTSDGQYYASTDAKTFVDEAQGIYYSEYVPYLIKIADGSYKAFPQKDGLNVHLSSIGDDTTLLGQVFDSAYLFFNGFALAPGETEFVTLYDFVKGIDPEEGDWMEENMTHDYEAYDTSDWTSYTETTLATGIPFATPDLSLIALGQFNFWGEQGDYMYYGYLLSLPPVEAGVEEIRSVGDADLKVLRDGTLLVSGDVKDVTMYSLNGLKAFSTVNPSGSVSTDLPAGIYLVKYTTASGKSITKKVAVR